MLATSILQILSSAEANLVSIQGTKPVDVTLSTSSYSMAQSAIAQVLIQRTAVKLELLKYYQSIGIAAPELLAEIEADLELKRKPTT